ncbi:hypothetical protein ACFPZK_12715 [Psychrobacter urativorans]|uniref:hypothetical protein n=1 Tax=Psychrobacter urativorans TaxID=45610 RepID=UPI003615F33A
MISHAGTELDSIPDLLVAITSEVVGFGSDKLEEKLSNSAKKVIEDISTLQSDFSGKNVVATDYK